MQYFTTAVFHSYKWQEIITAEFPHFEKLACFKTAITRHSIYTAPVLPNRRTIQNKYSKQEASSFSRVWSEPSQASYSGEAAAQNVDDSTDF